MTVSFSEPLQSYFGLLHSSGAAGGSQSILADTICRDKRWPQGGHLLSLGNFESERVRSYRAWVSFCMVWHAGRHTATAATPTDTTTTTTVCRSDPHQGWLWTRGWYCLAFALVVAVGRPDNWGRGCGMVTWNGQVFIATGRSNYPPGPRLWSRGWDAQVLCCSCWGCGQIRLPPRPLVWSLTRFLLGFPSPGLLARENRLLFLFSMPFGGSGSRSLWHPVQE